MPLFFVVFLLLYPLVGYGDIVSDILESRRSGAANVLPEELVPQESERFSPNIISLEDDALVVDWTFAEDLRLYHGKLKVVEAGADNEMTWSSTATELHQDPVFGSIDVLTPNSQLAIRFVAGRQPEAISLGYQGCSLSGVCYAPETVTLAVGGQPNLDLAEDVFATGLSSASQAPLNLMKVMTFFALGVALTFTPCVLPMLPVVAMTMSGGVGRRRGTILASLYVLGMATVYGAMGVAVSAIGQGGVLTSYFQHPAILVIFFLGMILAGMYTIGWISLSPSTRAGSFQRILAALQERMSPKSPGGAYCLGAIATLVVSPCVTGPVAGILLFLAQDGSALQGVVYLIALALGMGLPLIGATAFGVAVLPRRGSWMETVKIISAFALFLLAVWTIRTLMPHAVFITVITLLALTAVAMTCRSLLQAALGTTAAITLVAGIMMIAPAPLTTDYVRVTTLDDMLQEVGMEPALVKVTADWCATCAKLDRTIFSKPDLSERVGEKIVFLDVTSTMSEQSGRLSDFAVFGPPAIIRMRDGRPTDVVSGDISWREFEQRFIK